MKQGKVLAMQSGDQNSSNPYAKYIESIESLQRANSGVPPTTSSVSPAGKSLQISHYLPTNVESIAVYVCDADPSLDVASACKEYQLCKTPEEKSALKARLQPIIISRLEKLSGMEQRTSVGVEIADAVDFLTSLNPSDPRFVEIGKISETSRKGVISLQQGKLQLKEAQDKLLYQLRSLSPHHNKDD